MDIDEATRAYLLEMRALTRDTKGNAHLVGLTPKESALCLAYGRARMSIADSTPISGEQYLAGDSQAAGAGTHLV